MRLGQFGGLGHYPFVGTVQRQVLLVTPLLMEDLAEFAQDLVGCLQVLHSLADISVWLLL